ncbi:Hypotehical protein [Bacillus subtilis subsp. subtilis str. BSP1]|nr:Hypotehical protein [Bacillus subtilis subsp. subtilis str. BSP1]
MCIKGLYRLFHQPIPGGQQNRFPSKARTFEYLKPLHIEDIEASLSYPFVLGSASKSSQRPLLRVQKLFADGQLSSLKPKVSLRSPGEYLILLFIIKGINRKCKRI